MYIFGENRALFKSRPGKVSDILFTASCNELTSVFFLAIFECSLMDFFYVGVIPRLCPSTQEMHFAVLIVVSVLHLPTSMLRAVPPHSFSPIADSPAN